ncbi:MAG: M61 family peptidase [Imperialibacter sp.]|uniref:M61 family metallopeptidase n=1 Tax=Imperialibacter sp. TaxID=2038411 RepID=UPI0032EACCE2
MSLMKNYILLLLLPLLACKLEQARTTAASDASSIPIRYQVNFDNVQHHELRISIRFQDLDQDTLVLRMPQSSPGRYAVHNFAKNIYETAATDGSGKSITLTKTDISEWKVSGHDGEVRFTYTLYGNHGDGTYTGIDNRKAHLNMPASFVYGVGLDQRPIEITFGLDDKPDWDVATQLVAEDDDTFTAPNYYYFYDSPTMIGPMRWRRWKVEDNGEEYTVEIAAMVEDSEEALDNYTNWVKQVVNEEASVFGSFPDFDYNRYTFLVSYNPWIFGDGMEHRNSTVCSSQGSLAKNAQDLIGTISHEFFHAWNVERIRPQTLEPFNFDRANMSDALWFAEGFTSYYDDLILKRAGIKNSAEYVGGLAGGLNYVLNSPGQQIQGPVAMSKQAPFVDAGTANDETNYANTFVSYYSYGAALGLALDLSIRTRFEGKTLDDLMKYMWENYGQREIPYTVANLQAALGAITGDTKFADTFFKESIYGNEIPDLPPLLQEFGIIMQLKNPGKAGFPGLAWEEKEEGLYVKSPMLKSNPLYESGLERGNLVLTIDGEPVNSAADFERTWDMGSTHNITYRQNGLEQKGSFTIRQDPTYELVLMEDKGKTPSEKQLQKRAAWLEEPEG